MPNTRQRICVALAVRQPRSPVCPACQTPHGNAKQTCWISHKSDHQVELPSHVDLPRCFRWRNTTHFSYLLMFLLSPGFTNSGGIESRFYKLESSPVQSSFYNMPCGTRLPSALPQPSIDHTETNVLWSKFYLPPPSPHAMLFVRKGLPKSRPTVHWGEGGSKRILQCPTHFGQDCSSCTLSGEYCGPSYNFSGGLSVQVATPLACFRAALHFQSVFQGFH